MFGRLAHVLVRRRRRVLVGALVAFVLAGAFGGGVASKLSQGGFDDPGSESFRADEALEDVFEQGDPHVVLLVETTAPGAFPHERRQPVTRVQIPVTAS